MEEVLEEVGEEVTLVTVYPFDSCPTDPASAVARTEQGGSALTIQLVDDPLTPVAERWGHYPGSVFLVEEGGRIAYKRTRLVLDEVVRLIRGTVERPPGSR